jgi:hypothetical protein
MVVRTRSGAYRSLPRRTALGLIAAGRVTLEPAPVTPQAAPVTAVVPPAPHDDEHQALAATRARLADAMDVPVEAITPTPGSHPADVAAEQAQQAMDALAPVGDAEPDSIPADIPAEPAPELPPEPKPTARRGEWADYADSLGVEVTSAMTKREIQQAAEEAATSLANLPQPALTGGRLDTPEDEPVTDGSVTDDEDPRTR